MPRSRQDLFVNSIRTPVYSTATYFFSDTSEVVDYHRGLSSVGRYGRYDSPNWLEVEAAYATLEGANSSLLFPSGMSAIWTTFITFLRQGDCLAYSHKGYRNIRAVCREILPGLGVRTVPLELESQEAFIQSLWAIKASNPRIAFVETPSNPHQFVVDIMAVRTILGPDVLLIVDSTFASPINLQPLRHGADLVIQSATKYLGGHSDLVAGVVGGSDDLIGMIRKARDKTGAIAAPEVAARLHRSLETLPLRMAHHNRAGKLIAEALEHLPGIRRVFYSGLTSHPSYPIAKSLLTGHGAVITFELEANATQTSEFVDALEVPFMGTNFGGSQSMVEQPSIFTYFKLTPEERSELGISDSMIRYSAGLEDPQQILEDLKSALKLLT